MKTILDMLYLDPRDIHEPDVDFKNMEHTKHRLLTQLTADFTKTQLDNFELYRINHAQLNEALNRALFRYAFHLGAQMTLEIQNGHPLLSFH